MIVTLTAGDDRSLDAIGRDVFEEDFDFEDEKSAFIRGFFFFMKSKKVSIKRFLILLDFTI